MSSSLIESPGTLRPMLRLAMPVLVEQVLHLLVELVDLWITGNLLHNDAYLAAMALLVYVLWLVNMLFAFIFYGTTALTARFTGAGDRQMACAVLHQSLATGAIWSGVLMAIGLPTAGLLVTAMGLEADAAAAAVRYLTIVLCVLPCIMVERIGVAALRGAGDTLSGLVVMSLVNVINMATSYALVVGTGPLPALGWDGVAIGTAVGHCCGALMILGLLAAGRAGYRLRLRQFAPDVALIRRILRIGIPGGCDVLLICACHLGFVRVISSLGVTPMAAHGVALQIEALAYMPGGAFQIAASTLTGQYLGAGDPARAVRSALVACAAATGIMVSAGGVFYVAANPLAEFFLGGDSRAAAPLAAEILHVIAWAMAPLAIAMVASGALRGAGDTRWPLLITIAGMIAIRIPLAIYFAMDHFTLPGLGWQLHGLGWGVVGAWYAAVIDIAIRATLFAARFLHGGWKHIEV